MNPKDLETLENEDDPLKIVAEIYADGHSLDERVLSDTEFIKIYKELKESKK